MLASESDTAFAIEGKGLFAVRGEDGVVKYTCNGSNGNYVVYFNGTKTPYNTDNTEKYQENGKKVVIDENSGEVTEGDNVVAGETPLYLPATSFQIIRIN